MCEIGKRKLSRYALFAALVAICTAFTALLPASAFAATTHTITFDGNGHGGTIYTLEVEDGKSFYDALPFDDYGYVHNPEVTEGGITYTLDGWYYDQACTQEANFYDTNLNNVTQDWTLYAKWAEAITDIELTVSAPVCGTETSTEKSPFDFWDFTTQTNKPTATAASGMEYYVGDTYWIENPSSSPLATYLLDEAFIGTMEGGQDYYMCIEVVSDTKKFAKEPTITVNGATVVDTDWQYSWDEDVYFIYVKVSAVHDLAHVDAVDATCTEAGNIEHWKCAKCGKTFSDAAAATEVSDVTVAALGHKWDSGTVTKEPTCTEKGTKVYTCQNDTSHTKTEDVAALGHDWGEWTVVKAATTEAEGLERRVCSRDPSHIQERAIAKLDPAPEQSFFGVLISDTDGNANVGGSYVLDYPDNPFGTDPRTSPTNNFVVNGSLVTIKAIPASGYKFVGWFQGEPNRAEGEPVYSGSALSSNAEESFEAPLDLELPYFCAVFEKTTEEESSGSQQIAGQGTKDSGSKTTKTSAPSAGSTMAGKGTVAARDRTPTNLVLIVCAVSAFLIAVSRYNLHPKRRGAHVRR